MFANEFGEKARINRVSNNDEMIHVVWNFFERTLTGKELVPERGILKKILNLFIT